MCVVLGMRLAAAYHAETESVAGGSALSDALAALEGQAADRDPEPVGLRSPGMRETWC